MPCVNHAGVTEGLSPCRGCGQSFCIDCLIGRKSGWFCAGCDPERARASEAPGNGLSAASGGPPAAAPRPPAPGTRAAAKRACFNHPQVLDRLESCTRCDRPFCPDCLVELKGCRFCAACKAEVVQDFKSGVGESNLPLATIGSRVLAQLVDMIVVWMIMMPLGMVMGVLQAMKMRAPASGPPEVPLGLFLMNILFSGGVIAYEALMMQSRGQTLGKMALKIKVVSPDGSKISAGQAWARTLVRVFLSGCCFIGYISAFTNKERTTLHDMAAKTRVVRID